MLHFWAPLKYFKTGEQRPVSLSFTLFLSQFLSPLNKIIHECDDNITKQTEKHREKKSERN